MSLLDDLNLQIGDVVRTQKVAGGKYHIYAVMGCGDDGSLTLVANETGNVHSKFPDGFEVKVKGPRGGVVWEALSERMLTP